MKNSKLLNVRWGRVLLTGIVVYTLSYCIIFLVIAAYGFILAFRAQGAPDQDQIQQFATQISPWGVPALSFLLTFGATVWLSRKVVIATSLHGFLVGLIVVIISVILSLIFGWALNLLDLMWFFLIVVAGWFGGFLYSRGK